jgi:hypothetical protein
VLDSAPLEDAVTTQDTVTMLRIIGTGSATLQPLGLTTGASARLSRFVRLAEQAGHCGLGGTTMRHDGARPGWGNPAAASAVVVLVGGVVIVLGAKDGTVSGPGLRAFTR